MASPPFSGGFTIVTRMDGSSKVEQCQYTVLTEYAIMSRWETELSQLKEKKKRGWSNYLSDDMKQRSRVQYLGDIFKTKMHARDIAKVPQGSKIPKDGWAAVVSDAQYREFLNGTNSAYIIKALGLDTSQVAFVKHEPFVQSEVDRALVVDGVFDSDALHTLHEQNHTGHHHRNHSVLVPAKPGEPVRG